MDRDRLSNLVILGGGTAGWMTAIGIAQVLQGQVAITLVESEAIGTVGVGEATIPPIKLFNQMAKLDEDEFLRETKASLKLGIEFSGWGKANDRYIHLFGNVGQGLGLAEFFQYWLRAREEGLAKDFDLYSLTGAAARGGKASRATGIRGSKLEGITYAYHFDAGLYARHLRREAEKLGVTRVEGKVARVARNAESGQVSSLELEDGRIIDGQFFVDCSGFRALLIGDEMESAYTDWTHWLPCDRAVAVPCENGARLRPFTQSIAHRAGWQWRIPLQHRTGNGHVFSSAHMSEDEAIQTLLDNLEGEPLGDPRVLRFITGMRAEPWRGNVVAIGLSSGFLEPLESTSIHLIQVGITKLLSLWPDTGFDPAIAAEYNRKMRFEYESVRDFIIAHYHLNQRDEPFWKGLREMEIPDSLRRKLEVFAATGKVYRDHDELFTEIGWFQIMMGQNFTPRTYHPLADRISRDQLGQFLTDIETIVARGADQMTTHEDFLRSIGADLTLAKEPAA